MTPISTLDRALVTPRPSVPLRTDGDGPGREEGRTELDPTAPAAWAVADLWPLFEGALEAMG